MWKKIIQQIKRALTLFCGGVPTFSANRWNEEWGMIINCLAKSTWAKVMNGNFPILKRSFYENIRQILETKQLPLKVSLKTRHVCHSSLWYSILFSRLPQDWHTSRGWTSSCPLYLELQEQVDHNIGYLPKNHKKSYNINPSNIPIVLSVYKSFGLRAFLISSHISLCSQCMCPTQNQWAFV